MEKPPPTQPPKRNSQIAKILILVIILVALAFAIGPNFAQYQHNRDRRAEYISRITTAANFAELDEHSIMLSRPDGTWIVLKSDTGWNWGNWTLAVDSTGKWYETNDRNYDLMGEIIGYRSARQTIDELRTEAADPSTSGDMRESLKKMIGDLERRQQTYYPYRLQQAATLADARNDLHSMGFHDATELPAPRFTSTATAPTTLPASTPVRTLAPL